MRWADVYWAKYAEAFFRISLARRSSKFSRSSCLSRWALFSRQARTRPGITLGLANPLPERLRGTADLLGDRGDRRPL